MLGISSVVFQFLAVLKLSNTSFCMYLFFSTVHVHLHHVIADRCLSFSDEDKVMTNSILIKAAHQSKVANESFDSQRLNEKRHKQAG